MIRHLKLAAALLAVSALITACGGGEGDTRPKSVPTSGDPGGATVEFPLPRQKENPQFVGAQNCKECHEQAFSDWQKSDHFLAMQPASDDTVLGDFDDVTFTHFGHETRFFKRDGKFFVNTDDEKGQKRDFEVTHTFGFEPLQQYLIPFPGGRLQALQICWDTRPKEEGGQRWYHLYPDEEIPHDDMLHWTGRLFNWNYMCADCHSTHLVKDFDLAHYAYSTTWSEMNVSCEACHGPGADHVAWARETDEEARKKYKGHMGLDVRFSESEPGAWVIDPETMQPKRTRQHDAEPPQVEVCARCHSHRHPLEAVYTHGKPYHDTHLPSVLEDRLYHHDGQIKEEVYVYGSFLQSKMHHAGVRCTDCHQPHTMKPLAEGNALCVRCHTPDSYDTPAHHFHPPASSGASCVECHMPKTNYMVVDGRRDHSIRIPRPDLSIKLGTPNACTNCHTDKTNKWAADALEQWRAGRPSKARSPHPGEIFYRVRNGDTSAIKDLANLAADKDTNAIYRATAVDILGKTPTPEAQAAIVAVRSDPADAVRAAAAGAAAERDILPENIRMEIAIPLLKDSSRAVRNNAVRALAQFRNSMDPDTRESFDAAAKDFIESQQAIADQPGGHTGLGLYFQDLKDFEKAEKAFRTALVIDPGHIQSAAYLAELLHDLGRTREGFAGLANAAKANPRDPAIWRSLSFYHTRMGEPDKVLEVLESGLEHAPESTDLLYLYGLALNEQKQHGKAQGILALAHSMDPDNPDILFALACVARDGGQTANAIRYAQKLLPLSPIEANRLLLELGATTPPPR